MISFSNGDPAISEKFLVKRYKNLSTYKKFCKNGAQIQLFFGFGSQSSFEEKKFLSTLLNWTIFFQKDDPLIFENYGWNVKRIIENIEKCSKIQFLFGFGS